MVSALEAAQTPTSIYETLHQDDGDPIYILDQLSSEEDGEGHRGYGSGRLSGGDHPQ